MKNVSLHCIFFLLLLSQCAGFQTIVTSKMTADIFSSLAWKKQPSDTVVQSCLTFFQVCSTAEYYSERVHVIFWGVNALLVNISASLVYVKTAAWFFQSMLCPFSSWAVMRNKTDLSEQSGQQTRSGSHPQMPWPQTAERPRCSACIEKLHLHREEMDNCVTFNIAWLGETISNINFFGYWPNTYLNVISS